MERGLGGEVGAPQGPPGSHPAAQQPLARGGQQAGGAGHCLGVGDVVRRGGLDVVQPRWGRFAGRCASIPPCPTTQPPTPSPGTTCSPQALTMASHSRPLPTMGSRASTISALGFVRAHGVCEFRTLAATAPSPVIAAVSSSRVPASWPPPASSARQNRRSPATLGPGWAHGLPAPMRCPSETSTGCRSLSSSPESFATASMPSSSRPCPQTSYGISTPTALLESPNATSASSPAKPDPIAARCPAAVGALNSGGVVRGAASAARLASLASAAAAGCLRRSARPPPLPDGRGQLAPPRRSSALLAPRVAAAQRARPDRHSPAPRGRGRARRAGAAHAGVRRRRPARRRRLTPLAPRLPRPRPGSTPGGALASRLPAPTRMARSRAGPPARRAGPSGRTYL